MTIYRINPHSVNLKIIQLDFHYFVCVVILNQSENTLSFYTNRKIHYVILNQSENTLCHLNQSENTLRHFKPIGKHAYVNLNQSKYILSSCPSYARVAPRPSLIGGCTGGLPPVRK